MNKLISTQFNGQTFGPVFTPLVRISIIVIVGWLNTSKIDFLCFYDRFIMFNLEDFVQTTTICITALVQHFGLIIIKLHRKLGCDTMQFKPRWWQSSWILKWIRLKAVVIKKLETLNNSVLCYNITLINCFGL